MRFSIAVAPFLIALSTTTSFVSAGPIFYGICQSGCNAVAVACYAGAGATFGTVVAAPAAPAAILACNSALGICSAACASVTLLAPTP